jgi:hypothetical protein
MARVHSQRSGPDAEQQTEIDRLTETYESLVAEHGDEPPEAALADIEAPSDRRSHASATVCGGTI